MLVGDFQSKSSPVHKLFQYSGDSKRVHLTKLVIQCLWFDWSLMIRNINSLKQTIMENVPRCSMIVIQSFDINHVLWATFDIFP